MSLLPVDHLVRAVDGSDDLVQFRQDFVLDAKSLDSQTVTTAENGDLIIEGYAAVFDGMDRQGENFAPGAFQRGIKSFLDGQATLAYNHKHEKVLGKVLELREEEGKGLWMKARVDGEIASHPELGTIYGQIKKGTIRALSVGGYFKRALVNGRRMIADMDFTEISTTGVPVHSGTSFAVVAGKALGDVIEETPEVSFDFDNFFAALDRVSASFDALEAKALPDAHDPKAADHIATLLAHSQRTRQAATSAKEYSDHKGVQSAADAIETDLAAHEAKLHKLAAKVGPTPHAYV